MTVGIINSQFTPKTTLYLYKGVPIDAVNNTFWGCFTTKDEQKKFFDENYEHTTLKEYTYQRRDGTVNIEGEYDDFRSYNYMVYRNGESGNRSRWVYCFIKSVGYVSDFVCSIDFETDVIQTYRFEIEKDFKPSFVAYEHRPRWYIENGEKRACINTQPENMELGTDLEIAQTGILGTSGNDNTLFVIVCMTCNTSGEDSSASFVMGVPSQFRYYVFPYNIESGAGCSDSDLKMTVVLSDGTTVFNTCPIKTFYDGIRNNESLVNKCVSITITQSIPEAITDESGAVHFMTDKYLRETNSKFGEFVFVEGGRLGDLKKQLDSSHWELTQGIKVEDVYGYEETKLLWYPFSYMELTDSNGTTKAYKNEFWLNREAKFGLLGALDSSKVDYIPLNYKINSDGYGNFLINDIEAFQTGYEWSVPVVSDYTAALMQSSRNSLNANVSNTIRSNETSLAIASATSAAATQQTGIQNALSLNNTANNSKLNTKLTQIQIGAQADTAKLQSGATLVGGALSALGGDIGGAVGSGISAYQTGLQYAIDSKQQALTTSYQNAAATANANATAIASNASTQVSNALRETTTKYQANTNIQNAMASYTAQLHDAQASADSIVTGGSNPIRAFSSGLTSIIYRFYHPSKEYMEICTKTFRVRGYATNRYKVPNLHTRERWNYIQTVKCNIIDSDIEAKDMEKIKTAFDNGITLWHTKDVFDYSKSNNEIEDFSLFDKYGDYK